MTTKQEMKRKKTFPLEIEDGLHKALKFKAIESDMTLHAYIIGILNAQVHENSADYTAKDNEQAERTGARP